jgi:hypothetical protein
MVKECGHFLFLDTYICTRKCEWHAQFTIITDSESIQGTHSVSETLLFDAPTLI